MAKGKTAVEGRITGRLIIEQLVRNMALGQFEMGYSILLPCIFSLYLHPDDYTRLAAILDLIKENAERVHAEIRYEDDSGPQLFLMTQDEISIGRGGDDVPVNLALYTNDEVSREHLRIRRDAAQGRFLVVDKSMNGTWLNGKRLSRGTQEPFSGRAEIDVAEVITLHFEAK